MRGPRAAPACAVGLLVMVLCALGCGEALTPEARGALLDEADAHLMAGSTDEAARLFDRVLRADPEDPRAHAGAGLVALRRGDHEGAFAALDRAVRADADNVHYEFLRASALVNLGRDAEAVAALDALLTRRPGHGRAAMALMDLLVAQGRLDEAAQVAREAARRSQEDPEVLLSSGRVLLHRGALPEALECFDAARLQRPWAPEPMEAILETLVRMGRTSEAAAVRPRLTRLRKRADELEILRRSAVATATDPSPSILYIRMLFEEGRMEQTMAETRVFLQQFEGRPEGGALAVLAARAAIRAGDPDAALQFAGIAADLGERTDEERIALAEVLSAADHHEEAAAICAGMLEMMPRHPGVRAAVGRAQVGLARLEEAETHLRVALEVEPDHPAANAAWGLLRIRRGDPEEAVASLERALKIDPGAADAHLGIGLIAHQRRDLMEAEAALRRALALRPADLNARTVLALVLSEQDRCDEAIPHFTRALDRDFSNMTLHAGLIRCYETTGRVAEAAEARKVAGDILGEEIPGPE